MKRTGFSRPFLPILALAGALRLGANAAGADELSVPLRQTDGWQFLPYRKIPPNTFQGTPAGLVIGVAHSAAPAVFPLANQVQVTNLKVRGTISGAVDVGPDRQGQKGFDDYTLRVGLVEPGAQTLNWGERLVAPAWVKRLFALAPAGTGIGRIHFFNVGTDARQIGATRTNPLSALMRETIVAVPDARGAFAFTHRLASPLSVIALWLSSDGDDTKSSFTVTVEEITLEHSTQPR